MLSPRIRRPLVKLHRWTGLAIGVWIVLQSLTGLAIAWREDLDRLLVPSLTRGSGDAIAIDVQTALDRVRAAMPQPRISRIELPVGTNGVYRAWLGPSGSLSVKMATVDPPTGRVLGIAPLEAVPAEFLFRLHYALLLGDEGHALVGVLGSAYVLFLLLTGPLLWWPGRARFAASLRMKLDAGRGRALLDLHRVIGAIACVVLLPLAITGTLTALKPQLLQTLSLRGLSVPAVPVRQGVDLLPADSFVARALADRPDLIARDVRFAGAAGQNVTVVVGTRGGDATGRIYFNGYDGSVLAAYDRANVPPAIAVPETILWIHKGDLLGASGRFVIAAAALVPILLAITGIWMWLRRARSRRARSSSTASRLAA